MLMLVLVYVLHMGLDSIYIFSGIVAPAASSATTLSTSPTPTSISTATDIIRLSPQSPPPATPSALRLHSTAT